MATSAVQFKIDDRALRKALNTVNKLPRKRRRQILEASSAKMKEHTRDSMMNAKDPVTGQPTKPLSRGTVAIRPGKGNNNKPLIRTGALLRSIVSRRTKITTEGASIGSNLAYALIHQRGGTVYPKSTRYLAQPLTKEAARSKRASRWWKRWEGTDHHPFIITTAKGKFIARTHGSRGKVQVHWKLVTEMDVHARPYLGFSDKLKRDILGVIEMFIKAGIQDGK